MIYYIIYQVLYNDVSLTLDQGGELGYTGGRKREMGQPLDSRQMP